MFIERAQQSSAHSAAAWNAKHAGKPALTGLANHGYLRGRLFGRDVYAHRVIWKVMTGEDADIIDHGNHRKADNRWINLSSGDYVANARNAPLRSDNSTEHPGVSWDANAKRWVARITAEGRNFFLGHYHTKELAVSARLAAQAKHGFHVNHGRAAP
jgi:hypothetical protein